MDDYLLDTNAASGLLKGNQPNLTRKSGLISTGRQFIPSSEPIAREPDSARSGAPPSRLPGYRAKDADRPPGRPTRDLNTSTVTPCLGG